MYLFESAGLSPTTRDLLFCVLLGYGVCACSHVCECLCVQMHACVLDREVWRSTDSCGPRSTLHREPHNVHSNWLFCSKFGKKLKATKLSNLMIASNFHLTTLELMKHTWLWKKGLRENKPLAKNSWIMATKEASFDNRGSYFAQIFVKKLL